jgi:hypothetical protein
MRDPLQDFFLMVLFLGGIGAFIYYGIYEPVKVGRANQEALTQYKIQQQSVLTQYKVKEEYQSLYNRKHNKEKQAITPPENLDFEILTALFAKYRPEEVMKALRIKQYASNQEAQTIEGELLHYRIKEEYQNFYDLKHKKDNPNETQPEELDLDILKELFTKYPSEDVVKALHIDQQRKP